MAEFDIPCMHQGGLLMTTTAAFATTEPPDTAILDFTKRGSYICLWLSFSFLLSGIVVGSGDTYIISSSSAEWTLEVRHSYASSKRVEAKLTIALTTQVLSSRTRVLCMLILFASPFFIIAAGILLFVAGKSIPQPIFRRCSPHLRSKACSSRR